MIRTIINVGLNREAAIQFFSEALAEANTAPPGTDFEAILYGTLNDGSGRSAKIVFSNDDMEGRDDIDPDDIYVEVEYD